MVAFAVAATFTLAALGQTGPQLDPQNQQIRDRYLASLHQNPVQDQAFARVYESYLTFDGVDAWIAALKKETEAPETKAAALILLGRVYQRQFKMQEALQAMEEAAALGAPAPEFQALLGSLYVDTNKFDRAVELLSAARDGLTDATKRAQVCRTLGGVLMRLGKRDEAIAAWQKLVEIAPDDPFAYEELAAIYEDNLMWPEAIGAWKSLLDRSSNNPYLQCRAWRAIGEDHERAATYPDAIAAYEKALGLAAPGNWLFEDVKERLVGVYERMGDLEGLEKYLEAQIAAMPSNLDFPDLLAETFTRRGKLPEAEAVLQRVLERAPGHIPTCERLIALYARMDAPDKQRAMYEKLIESIPAEPDYIRRLGETFLVAGDAETAKATWRRVLKADAKPEDHALVASWFEQYEFPVDAIPEYETAIAAKRDREWVFRLADLKYTAGKSEEAVALWKSVLTPESTASDYAEVASVLASNKLETEASELYAKAIELDPKAYEHRAAFARLCMSRKAYPDALAQFSALAGQTENEYHHSLGERGMIDVYAATGELEAKQKEWEDEAAKSPDQTMPKLRLAHLYERLGNRQRMVELYEQCTQLEPDVPAHWQELAESYSQMRLIDKAIAAYEKLIAIDATRVGQYCRALVHLYMQANRKDDAVAAAQRAAELAPDDVEVRTMLAQTYLQFQRPDEALQQMRNAIRLKADDPRLYAQYGDALTSLQRLGEARDAFRKMMEVSPSDAERVDAVARLANVYQQQQRAPELIQEFKERVRQAPKDISAYQELAAIYRATGEVAKPIEVYESASASVEDKAAVLRLMLTASYDAGKLDKVVSVSEQLMAMSGKPSMSDWERLGAAYAQLGNYEKAKESWDRITSENPKDANAYKLLARTLSNWGQVEESFAARRKAIELDPTDYSLRIEYAQNLTQFDKVDEAIKELIDLLEASQLADDSQPTPAASSSPTPAPMTYPPSMRVGRGRPYPQGYVGGPYPQGLPYGSLQYYRPQILSMLVETARRTENLEPIVERFKKRMEEMPGNFRVKQDLFELYQQLGKNEEAIALGQAVLQQQPDNADLRWRLLSLYTATKQYDAMEREYQAMMERDPANKIGAELGMFRLYRLRGDNAKSLEYGESLLKQYADNEQVIVALAQSYAESGDVAKVKELLARATEINPQNAQNYRMQLAQNYQQRGQVAEAKAVYEDIIFAPAPPQQPAMRSRASGASLYVPQAYPGARQGGSMPQSYGGPFYDYTRAQALQQLQQMTVNLADLQPVLDRLKTEADKWFNAGTPEEKAQAWTIVSLYLSTLDRASKFDEGLAFVKRLHEAEPDNNDIAQCTLYFMDAASDYDGMLALYKEIEARNPSMASSISQARFNIAVLQDNLEQAVQLYRERLNQKSAASAMSNMGDLYPLMEKLRRQKRMDLLVPILEEQAQMPNPNIGVLQNLVQAYIGNHEADKAIAVARRAWENAQRNPLAMRSYGMPFGRGMPGQNDPAFSMLLNAYQQAQQVPKLTAEFEERLKQQPDSQKLRECLIALYDQSGRQQEAIDLYKDLCARRPNSPQTKMELAQFLSNHQRHDEAIKIYEELLRTQPSLYFTVSWQVRETYRQAGKDKQLATLDNEMAQRTTDTRRLQELAQQQLNDQAFDQAAALYERILKSDPNAGHLRMALAEAYRKGGKSEESIRVYKEILSRADSQLDQFINFHVMTQVVEFYGSLDRLPELKEEVAKAAQANVTSMMAKGLLAAIAKSEKRYDDAMKLLEEINAARPGQGVISEIINVAEAQQDYDRAISLMENQMAAQGSLDWNRLATLYLKKGDRKKAFETFKREVDTRNNLYAMSDVLRRLIDNNMLDEAKEYANEAFTVAKNDENVIRQIGYSLSEAAQKSPQMAEFFEKEILTKDQPAMIEVARQHLYRYHSNPKKIREILTPLMAAHPDNPELMQIYVEMLGEQMSEDELISAFSKLSTSTSDNWYPTIRCAQRLAEKGKLDAIMEPLKVWMVKNPGFSQIQQAMQSLTNYGRFQCDAIKLRDEILAQIPEDKRLLAKAGFADATARAGDTAWAHDALQEAYKTRGDNAAMQYYPHFLQHWGYWDELIEIVKVDGERLAQYGEYNNFGALLMHGEIDLVESLAEKSLIGSSRGGGTPQGFRDYLGTILMAKRLEEKVLAAESPNAYQSMIWAYEGIEDHGRAQELLVKMLEKFPGRPENINVLDQLISSQQDPAQSLPLLEKFYATLPQGNVPARMAWQQMARVYIQAGRKEEARKILDSSSINEGDFWQQTIRAQLYAQAGDTDKAIADVEAVLKQPINDDGLVFLLPALVACGRVDEAMKLWRDKLPVRNPDSIVTALSQAGKHAE
ncbi:MAG: tetratricopeptide repeat protein, partial [Candidatus Hydrogenedentes bacterium]|nr:tetratricopeptide repeat protein [Candidatus Hydrogenedentota bacterium]